MTTKTYRITGLVNFESTKTRHIQVDSRATEKDAHRAFALFFRGEPVKILACEELATLETQSAEIIGHQTNLFNNA